MVADARYQKLLRKHHWFTVNGWIVLMHTIKPLHH
jgi:hypothetical protein